MTEAGKLGRHKGFSGRSKFATLADTFATLAKNLLTEFPRRGSVSCMKHRTTHPTHPAAALLAAVMLTFLASIATSPRAYGQAAVPVDDGEVLTVKSQVVRVGIAVPPDAGPFRLEVTGGGARKVDFAVDRPGPSSPLSLVVLLDISSPSSAAWREVGERLSKLPRQLGLKEPPTLVIVHPEFRHMLVGQLPRLPFEDPDWGGAAWPLDIRSAFDYATRMVDGFKTPRRALLVVTDRFAEMPADIFERTDARLVNNPALVYAVSVHPQKAIKYGSPDRTISRMNLVGFENVRVRASSPYVDVQFRHFARCANALHVVSFQASEQEVAAAPVYEVEVRALAENGGRLLNRQPRRLELGLAETAAPAGARDFPFDASPAPALVPVRAALDAPAPSSVEEWIDSDEFRSLAFDPRLVTSRIVTDPEARAHDIGLLPDWIRANRVADAEELKRARQRLQPILDYLHAGELQLLVFRDAVPVTALGEKSLLIVSTASLEYPDSELRAALAHEIAHLFFFDAYLAATLKNDGAAIKRIELMCDALGAVWSASSGEPDGALLRAVKRTYELEARHGGQDPARAAMYPTVEEREAVMRHARTVVASYKLAEARE